MLFLSKDTTGALLPAGFEAELWKPGTKPVVTVSFDFLGDYVKGLSDLVDIPSEDILSFAMSDKVEGTNGRACSNTITLELNNYGHKYSAHLGTPYDPDNGKYNGSIQSDGRGNLRPGRIVTVRFGLEMFPGVEVLIFEGRVGAGGFKEQVGAGNINSVKVEAQDYAKMLIDKDPKGEKVFYSGQWVEKTLAFEDCTVSNPASPSSSIIHKLVAVADPLSEYITVDAQTINIHHDYIPIDGNIWSEIATLAESCHAIASFTGRTLYFGDSRLFAVTEPNPPIVFGNDDFASISHEDNTEAIKNKMSVKYSSYKKMPLCALWMYDGSDEFGRVVNPPTDDLTGADLPPLIDPDVIFKCKYAIVVNTPAVGGGSVVAPAAPILKKEADNYEVVLAKNLAYSFETNHSNYDTLDVFDVTTLRDSAIIKKNKGAMTSIVVRSLVIRGEPVVKHEQNQSFADNQDSVDLYGKKHEDYENKFVTRQPVTFNLVATTHDKAWLDIALSRFSVPRRKYQFEKASPMLTARSGTIVQLTEDRQGTGINVKVRLESVSIKYNGQKNEWQTSFSAMEEVALSSAFDYAAMVGLNRNWPLQRSRGMSYIAGLPLSAYTPYKPGDMILWSDGNTYIAKAYKGVGEDLDLADFAILSGYRVAIESSHGTEINPDDDITVTMNAKVFNNTQEITSTLNASVFLWSRESFYDTSGDAAWNAAHQGTKSVSVLMDNLAALAKYMCVVTVGA
jgi:hypothetical protein